MTETERAIAIIEARLPLYTDIGQINALRECISSIRSAALSAGQAQPVAIKPLEWQHDGNASYCYCPVTDVRWTARNPAERAHAEATREARIRSALVPPAVPGEVEKRVAPVDVYKVLKRAHDNGRLSIDFISNLAREIAALSVPLPEIEGGDKGDIAWDSPEECAIEQRAFHAAGRDDVPADVQQLVAKLWAMYCRAAAPSQQGETE